MWYKKFHVHMLTSLKIIQVFLKWSKKSDLEMSFPNGSHHIVLSDTSVSGRWIQIELVSIEKVSIQGNTWWINAQQPLENSHTGHRGCIVFLCNIITEPT